VTEPLIFFDPDSKLSLQAQIRQKLVEGVVNGAYPGGSPLNRGLSQSPQPARHRRRVSDTM
jgi:hypothetical protein